MNKVVHYTDGIWTGQHIEGELRKQFFELFDSVVRMIKNESLSPEKICALLGCLKFNF